MKTRAEQIRAFQNGSSPGAHVFVFTVKLGSVGLTLTAATRVYLMEPAFDPTAFPAPSTYHKTLAILNTEEGLLPVYMCK